MAHKKSGGSSSNGRDSAGRRLGVKKFGGEAVVALGHERGGREIQQWRAGREGIEREDPELGRILVVFTDDAGFEFGELWQGAGPGYVLASEAFCR